MSAQATLLFLTVGNWKGLPRLHPPNLQKPKPKTMRNKIIPYNPKLKELARKLRKNSTFSEIIFWKAVKGKSFGVEFHRQVPIDEYIVDFFCHELMLVIELDGDIHGEDDVIIKDIKRQERLESLGLKVVRIRNRMVKYYIRDCLEFLMEVIKERRLEMGQ